MRPDGGLIRRRRRPGGGRADHQIIALMKPRHDMGSLDAHRLGGQEIHRRHAALAPGNLHNALIEHALLLGREARRSAGQRHTPDPAKNLPRIGQFRRGVLNNRALLFQQPRRAQQGRLARLIQIGRKPHAAHHGDAHARHAILNAGPPVARLIGQAEGVTQVKPRHGAEHQGSIAHRARHRPRHRHRRKTPQRPLRHPAKARLETHHTAPGGGNANRAPRIRANMQRPKMRRRRRTRAGG